MGKCLITKLNGTVKNDSILKLGEFIINCKDKCCFILQFSKEATLRIAGVGYFSDSSYSGNKGKILKVNADEEINVYVVGTCQVICSDKYNLISVFCQNSKTFTFDIECIKYSKQLRKIGGYAGNITGNLSNLTGKENLEIMALNYEGITGNLKDINNLPNLDYIAVGENINGNLSDLIAPEVSNLNILGNHINGTLSDLQAFKKLTDVFFKGIDGNLKDLSSLNLLTSLYDTDANISGDVAILNDNFKFLDISRSKGSLTWSSRKSSATIISIKYGLKFSNVDKVLQDEANCQVPDNVSEKIIAIQGTRTSASDAAVQTLQGKGYTVIVDPE